MTEENTTTMLDTTITNHAFDEDGIKINILYKLGWFRIAGISERNEKAILMVRADGDGTHEEPIAVPYEDWAEIYEASKEYDRGRIRDDLFGKLDLETLQRHRDEAVRTNKLLGIYDKENGEEST
jgi:hypothetical protein